MLVLGRRPGESITIHGPAVITVISVDGQYVRLGFKAPDTTKILRTELGEPRDDKAA